MFNYINLSWLRFFYLSLINVSERIYTLQLLNISSFDVTAGTEKRNNTNFFIFHSRKGIQTKTHWQRKKTRTYFCHVSIPYQSHEKIICFQQYHLSEIWANKKLILLIFCYQFDIYFYVGSFDEELTEDMEEEKTLSSYTWSSRR